MAVAALDPRIQEYSALLCDRSQRVSELELRRISKDLEAMLARVVDPQLVSVVHDLRATCYERLGQPSKSLRELRLALQWLREPTPMRAAVLGNQAAAFLALARYREAALSSLEASRISGGYNHVNLANLAEALHHLGEPEAALRIFQEALGLADLANPSHCFAMAAEAAELGLDQDALELFARFLARRRGTDHDERSAIEIVRTSSVQERASLENAPILEATIQRMTAMADELARLPAHLDVEGEASSPEAQDVYEATRRLREEALADLLPT
jgi:tetratricopeptide (TPR) repeat protein